MNRAHARYCLILAAAVATSASSARAWAEPPRLPPAAPEDVGMDPGRLALIDEAVAETLAEGKMPGCVVLVSRYGKQVFLKAYGRRALVPEPVEMTPDTVFDVASLTKPIATATSVMLLSERSQLGLDDAAAQYLADFGRHGKEQITIRQLLTHQGGLIADNPLSDFDDGADAAFKQIDELEPIAPPGTRFVYSDVGFIVLGKVIEQVSGQDLHAFTRQQVFEPLGMRETTFLPAEELRRRSAPTEQRDGRWMQGEVHDPRAFQLGGGAGHAGLFSTADDLAVYAQMLLNQGTYAGVRVLEPETVQRMISPQQVPGGLRGLGWDIRTGYSSNRGDGFSPSAFGHGGFTGTSLWIDPELELCVIFLSNRLHPDGKGAVNPLAGRIGGLAAAAIQPPPAARAGVLTGIDVLQRDQFALLRGRRVGLITNHTGVDRSGTSSVQLLAEAPGVELVALFSPEHGFEGKLDQPQVADSREPRSRLPIYSLYGETRKPTAESLQGIDTLVFDIQDIGARFYTYISTMGAAMEAAAEHGLRFVVLDRPNPINGVDVAGPLLDAGSESFVGYHRLPVRHGMTVGELAQLFNAERKIGADLHVVRLEGWRRADFFDATGLPWINPSPNMRSLTQALLYPGIGLLETTNVSVGRGTDTPFEVIGAPWLDGHRLTRQLRSAGLPGVTFVPIRFTPQASTHQGQACGGIEMIITDRSAFDPLALGLHAAVTLRRLYPDQWDSSRYGRLLGNRQVLEALQAGASVNQLQTLYQAELEAFCSRRQSFLMYPE